MPVSKAQQKAVNKYMSENYDRINLTVPKGQKEIIKAHAEAHSEFGPHVAMTHRADR